MKEFSYIISYRHSEERFQNIQIVLNWISKLAKEVIIVESDTKSHLSKLLDKYEFKHIFLENNYPFNKSWCFNVGWKSSKFDSVVFGDADLIMDIAQFEQALNELDEHDSINPYRSVVDLTKTETNIYKTSKNFNFLESIARPGRGETDHQKVPFCGGIIMFKKQCLENISGWDENFFGWGAEDDAQSQKLFILNKKIKQLENRCYHLYHERQIPNQELYFRNLSIYNNLIRLDKKHMENYLNETKMKIGDINKLNS